MNLKLIYVHFKGLGLGLGASNFNETITKPNSTARIFVVVFFAPFVILVFLSVSILINALQKCANAHIYST